MAALDDEVRKLEEDLATKVDSFKDREVYELLDNNGGPEPVPERKFKQLGNANKITNQVNGLSWIDEKHIAVASQVNTVVIYNVFAGSARSLFFKSTWLNCVNFKRDTAGTDQAKIAYGGLDNIITVANFQHKSIIDDATLSEEESKDKTFVKHGGPIYDISWCPGTNIFASGSGDSTIMLWSLDQPNQIVKEPEMTFSGHQGDVSSLTWLDTNVLLSGAADTTCRLFDKRIGGAGIVQTFAGHEGPVSKVCTMNNNRSFVSCSEDQTVKVWDIRAKSCFGTYGDVVEESDDRGKSAMCLSKSGRIAFVGNERGSIDSIDLLTGQIDNVSNKYHTERVTSCELSISGNAFATSSRNKEKGSFAIWA